MTRFLALLLCALAACGGPTPAKRSNKPPDVSLLIQNVSLATGSSLIVGMDNATPSVSLIVTHDPNSQIDAYLIDSAQARLPKLCGVSAVRRDCVRDIGTGVRESLEARTGNRGKAVAFVLRSGPPLVDLRLIYPERSRQIEVRIPAIASGASSGMCKDNGCNPFIEVMPVRSGLLRASATFKGTATMRLEQGRIIGKSFTATGIPYRALFEATNASSLHGSGHLDAGSEAALELINGDGSRPLLAIDVRASWP